MDLLLTHFLHSYLQVTRERVMKKLREFSTTIVSRSNSEAIVFRHSNVNRSISHMRIP